MRTQSPWPDPATAAGEVRSERFYYDGVRRVQEVLLDPLLSLTSALASSNATLQTLAQQASTQNGVPLDGEATPATLEQGQASTLVGGAATFTGVLWREYVWGPGDGFGSGGGGVDELLVQFDQNDNAWWALVDAGGDVAALAGETGTPTAPGAARVAAQWTYDAYGNVTSADHLHPHALLHCGHKGLFAERLDVGAAEVETTGFASAESPRLVPFGRIVYHNRNRMYSPGIGRFLQADPNATGMVTSDVAYSGRDIELAPDEFDVEDRHADGANVFAYLGSQPWTRSDPMGLKWGTIFSMVLPSPTDYATGMLNSLVSDYAANQEWDVEWATRWDLPDEDYSRTDNSWIELALMRGLYETLADDDLGIDVLVDPLEMFAAKRMPGTPRGPRGTPGAGGGKPRGGYTIAVQRGQQAHKNYKNALGAGYEINISVKGVGRPDAIDFKNKIVRELKPDTPSGRALGAKQLNRYLNALRNHSDPAIRGNWTGYLDYYTP